VFLCIIAFIYSCCTQNEQLRNGWTCQVFLACTQLICVQYVEVVIFLGMTSNWRDLTCRHFTSVSNVVQIRVLNGEVQVLLLGPSLVDDTKASKSSKTVWLVFSPIQLTRIGAAKFLLLVLWITLLPDFHVVQRQDPHSRKCLDIQFCGISFLAIVDLNSCHIDSGPLINSWDDLSCTVTSELNYCTSVACSFGAKNTIGFVEVRLFVG